MTEPDGSRPAGAWWRSAVAGLAIVLAGCGVATSSLALWAHHMIADADAYARTVAPLASDPSVQDAVADAVGRLVVDSVDIEGLANQAAQASGASNITTAAIQALAARLAQTAEDQIRSTTQSLVSSPQFPALWESANRVAHEQVVSRLVHSDGSALGISAGTVTLDVQPIVSELREQLVAANVLGASLIPDTTGTVTIIQSDALAQAEKAIAILNDVARWLPWATLGLIASAVLLARNRLRGVAGLGLSVAVFSGLVLAGMSWGVRSLTDMDFAAGIDPGIIYQLISEPRTVAIWTSLGAVAVFVIASAFEHMRGRTQRAPRVQGDYRSES